MHARQQIQDAMVTALQFAATVTVQAGRVWIYQPVELPIVGVYTNEEADSLDEGTFDAIGRELALVCELVAEGTDGDTVNSTLNAMASEVETILGTQRQVLGILDCVPGAYAVEMSSESENVKGKAIMEFTVLYRTAIGSPETII